MKADFSRIRNTRGDLYQRVLSLQGTVSVDTDWNEQMELIHQQMRRSTTDLLGPCSSPDEGFAVESRSLLQFKRDDRARGRGYKVTHSETLLSGKHAEFTLACSFSTRDNTNGTLIARQGPDNQPVLHFYLDAQQTLCLDLHDLHTHRPSIHLRAASALAAGRWIDARVVLSCGRLSLWVNQDRVAQQKIDANAVAGEPTSHAAALHLGQRAWHLLECTEGKDTFSGEFHDLAFYDFALPGTVASTPGDALAFWSADHLRRHHLEDTGGGGHHAIPEASHKEEAASPVADHALVLRSGTVYLDGVRLHNACDQLLEPPTDAAHGLWLITLEARERLVNALDDPTLRDPGLQMADAASRVVIDWTPRWIELPEETPAHRLTQPALSRRLARTVADAGTLMARRRHGLGSLENHLYRVEVHSAPTATAPGTFKWSRDNASIAVPIIGVDLAKSLIALPQHVSLSMLLPNKVVEWTDTFSSMHGVQGLLLKVTQVNEEMGTIQVDGLTDDVRSTPGARLICWDHSASSTTETTEPLTPGTWLPIEDGIEIFFEPHAPFQTGDYWTFAAREATGHIDWPIRDQQPVPLPSAAEVLRQPLAVVSVESGKARVQANFCARFAALGRLPLVATKTEESVEHVEIRREVTGDLVKETVEVIEIECPEAGPLQAASAGEEATLVESEPRPSRELRHRPAPAREHFRLQECLGQFWEGGFEGLGNITAAVAHGNTVFVADDAGLLHSSTGSLSTLRSFEPPIPTGKETKSAALAASSDQLWMCHTDTSPKVFCMNRADNTWREYPAPPESQPGAAAAIFRGELYLTGGNQTGLFGRRAVPLVQRLEPEPEQWHVHPPLLTARSRVTPIVTHSGIVVLGGVTYPRVGLLARTSGIQEVLPTGEGESLVLPSLPDDLRVLCAFDHGDHRHAYCVPARRKDTLERYTYSAVANVWWRAGGQRCDTANLVVVHTSHAVLAIRRSRAGNGPRVLLLASLLRS